MFIQSSIVKHFFNEIFFSSQWLFDVLFVFLFEGVIGEFSLLFPIKLFDICYVPTLQESKLDERNRSSTRLSNFLNTNISKTTGFTRIEPYLSMSILIPTTWTMYFGIENQLGSSVFDSCTAWKLKSP